LYMTTDLALYAHFGIALLDGILKVGFGAKALNRAEVDKPYSSTPAASQVQSQWLEGTGFGFDAGALLQIPVFMVPTFGLAVHEIGGTQLIERRLLFSGSAGAGAPAALRQRVDTGFALHGKHGRGIKSGIAFDYKDVTNASLASKSHLHTGLEINFRDILFLRAGYSAFKYWSAGIGLHAPGAGLEVASYGEDITFRTGSVRADRKWVGRYVLSF
jgi:hypothetical protein